MQINRLFEIVYILLSKETVTAKELAARFEVSSRTIYRDVETLSSSGIPVYMSKGKGGGISLLPDFVLNKAILTDAERSDILSSLKAISSVNHSATDTALKKMSSLFGEANADWIEVDFTSWCNREEEKAVFNTIKSSILSKSTISFTYSSGKGENTKRKVEPLKLCFREQGWYLYGHCKARSDYRFFKLRRIKDLCVLEETFKRKSPVETFSEINVFGDQYVTLKLKISSKMAFRVYDEFNSYEQLDDGSFIVEAVFPKGDWIFNYAASFGEHCEILGPEDIRIDMKNKLKNILDNYL